MGRKAVWLSFEAETQTTPRQPTRRPAETWRSLLADSTDSDREATRTRSRRRTAAASSRKRVASGPPPKDRREKPDLVPLHVPYTGADRAGQAKQRMEHLSNVLATKLRQDQQREQREAAEQQRQDQRHEQQRLDLIRRLKDDSEKIKRADEKRKKKR